MSYILDALRKSERERKRSAIPDPLTVQDPLPAEKKIRSIWSYVFVLGLLVSTLVSGLWAGLWYAKKPPENKSRVSQSVSDAQEQNLQSTPETRNDHPPVRKDTAGEGESPQGGSDTRERKKKQEHLVQKTEDRNPIIISPSPTDEIRTPQADKEIPPPDKNKLYDLQELPASLRYKLPDFTFSVFLYTDEPASRTVRVNGVMMKEGQYLTEGLKLEEIIPDGVVFSYMDYRFRVVMR